MPIAADVSEIGGVSRRSQRAYEARMGTVLGALPSRAVTAVT
jgi:hypothetical protein